MIWLWAMISVHAQTEEVIPPVLVGTGLDVGIYLFEKLGWPGLIMATVIYLWRHRDRNPAAGAGWRGIPLVLQVEITKESADLLQRVYRGRRVPSEATKEREKLKARLAELDAESEHSASVEDENTTPQEARPRKVAP